MGEPSSRILNSKKRIIDFLQSHPYSHLEEIYLHVHLGRRIIREALDDLLIENEIERVRGGVFKVKTKMEWKSPVLESSIPWPTPAQMMGRRA